MKLAVYPADNSQSEEVSQVTSEPSEATPANHGGNRTFTGPGRRDPRGTTVNARRAAPGQGELRGGQESTGSSL